MANYYVILLLQPAFDNHYYVTTQTKQSKNLHSGLDRMRDDQNQLSFKSLLRDQNQSLFKPPFCDQNQSLSKSPMHNSCIR